MQASSYSDSLSMDPQKTLPWFRGPIQPGVVYHENGDVTLNFYAPNASEVKVAVVFQKYDMVAETPGFWTLTLHDLREGFHPIRFYTDGSENINPMAPIGYGGSRITNYIDVPEKGNDFLDIKDVPHGAVTREFYKSSVTGEFESCLVYTPPEYHLNPEKHYPVVYLQHGAGENETSWVYQGKINFMTDNLLAENKAVPFIIVMNAGGVRVKGETEWTCDYFQLIFKD